MLKQVNYTPGWPPFPTLTSHNHTMVDELFMCFDVPGIPPLHLRQPRFVGSLAP